MRCAETYSNLQLPAYRQPDVVNVHATADVAKEAGFAKLKDPEGTNVSELLHSKMGNRSKYGFRVSQMRWCVSCGATIASVN